MANDAPTHNSPNTRRIVHLGLGAFFRAHGALYVQEAALGTDEPWEITGVSMKSPKTRDMLIDSKYHTHVMEKHIDQSIIKELTIINKSLFIGEDYEETIERIVSRETFLVTLTITEKGYCRLPATGRLDQSNPEIQHDLSNLRATTAIGLIVRGLSLRKSAGFDPFTVLSCDNLPANGKLTRQLVLDFAALKQPDLADWIARECRFPSCMVDRIVPATTEADHTEFYRLAGKQDAALVTCEPFRQWVIEDDFVGAIRPKFESVGVQMVRDVAPFETMKLRLLNGSHSALAWLGRLLGLGTIHEAINDPDLSHFVRYLWALEIIPTVRQPEGQDLDTYVQSLFDRYSNPNIRHSLHQIASDSSQKIPQRILATIADNLASNRKCPGLILAVAAFVKSSLGKTEAGVDIPVNDPAADQIVAVSQNGVGAVLNLTNIFPSLLSTEPLFQAELSKAWDRLNRLGVRKCIQSIIQ